MPWELILILLAVAAVLCCVGFYKFVYFLSVGYGLAVSGIGIALAVFGITGLTEMTVPSYIMCGLFLIYGIRLSGFLIIRELKNAAYRKTLAEATKEDKPMPIFVKAVIWIAVTLLYVAQTSPVLFASVSEKAHENPIFSWIGVGIAAIGLILETLADKQKSQQKSARPDMVATKGLYRMVRCPNYFGEIVFWTGVFVSAIPLYANWGQWLTAVLGYICIVYVMINGAQRLEKRQNGRYGKMEEYQNYVKKTPILFPLLPIYSLNKKEK